MTFNFVFVWRGRLSRLLCREPGVTFLAELCAQTVQMVKLPLAMGCFHIPIIYIIGSDRGRYFCAEVVFTIHLYEERTIRPSASSKRACRMFCES